jgi:hypothetical protein
MQSPRTEALFADARKATIVIVPAVTRRARPVLSEAEGSERLLA